jgi:hypothetical protein
MSNDSIDLDINSIFEMLPQGGRIVIVTERGSDRTWSQGKAVVVAEVSTDTFTTLTGDDFMYAIGMWEIEKDRRFDAMELTEKDSVEILKTAVQCKRKR